MIIHYGDGESEAEYAMYDIRGITPRDTRAVEVEVPQAQFLNSMCCFVLITPDRAYVWHGTGSNTLFREMADFVCNRLRGTREALTIMEVHTPNPRPLHNPKVLKCYYSIVGRRVSRVLARYWWQGFLCYR